MALPALAAAQVTAVLTVQVKDTVGVLPGAAVTVVRRQSNTATRQVTDGEGRAEFAWMYRLILE